MPEWINIVGLAVIVAGLIGSMVFKYPIDKIWTSSRQFEICGDSITVLSPTSKVLQKLEAKDFDAIVVPEEFKMPLETWRDMINAIQGRSHENYVIVSNREDSQRFDFELDSYYMTAQLEKIIVSWIAKGYPVKRIKMS